MGRTLQRCSQRKSSHAARGQSAVVVHAETMCGFLCLPSCVPTNFVRFTECTGAALSLAGLSHVTLLVFLGGNLPRVSIRRATLPAWLKDRRGSLAAGPGSEASTVRQDVHSPHTHASASPAQETSRVSEQPSQPDGALHRWKSRNHLDNGLSTKLPVPREYR